MKSAFIAAVVAAIVAAGAATAATSIVITSAQIKNGTIKLVDISASAKRGLKGNRGPRGLQGPPGAQGTQGAQGLPGGFDPAKLQYITGPEVAVPPGEVGTAAAYCPAGTTAISGGFFASITNVGASQTYGSAFHAVIVWNDTSIAVNIFATVVCAAR